MILYKINKYQTGGKMNLTNAEVIQLAKDLNESYADNYDAGKFNSLSNSDKERVQNIYNKLSPKKYGSSGGVSIQDNKTRTIDADSIYADKNWMEPITRFIGVGTSNAGPGYAKGESAAKARLAKPGATELSEEQVQHFADLGYIPTTLLEADKKRVRSLNSKVKLDTESDGWTPGVYGAISDILKKDFRFH